MMRLRLSGLIVVIFGASLLHLAIAASAREEPTAAYRSLWLDYLSYMKPKSAGVPEPYLSAYTDFDDAGGAYMSVYVVVDEEFIEYLGDNWRDKVRNILVEANTLTTEAGLGLRLHSSGHWHSQDDVKFISSHIPHISQQVKGPPGHITQ